MLERVLRIEGYVAGLDREGFLNDNRTADAVVRNLEVIGEAARNLDGEFIQRHFAVPWRRIAGLRNRVVHEYFDVDLLLVWEIVQAEVPALKLQLRAIQEEASES